MPREDITQHELTDDDLKLMIARALAWDGRVHYPEVWVEVDDGVVILSGIVETEEEKAAVEEVAHNIPGLVRIINAVAVKPPTPLTDDRIAAAAIDALRKDGRLDARYLDVSVRRGRVTLRGEVLTEAQKRAALDNVRIIPGVTDVRDELTVLPDGAESDRVLEDLVNSVLSRTADLSALGIHARVEHGLVHLRGCVQTYHQRNAVRMVVEAIPGVGAVANELVVAEE